MGSQRSISFWHSLEFVSSVVFRALQVFLCGVYKVDAHGKPGWRWCRSSQQDNQRVAKRLGNHLYKLANDPCRLADADGLLLSLHAMEACSRCCIDEEREQLDVPKGFRFWVL